LYKKPARGKGNLETREPLPLGVVFLEVAFFGTFRPKAEFKRFGGCKHPTATGAVAIVEDVNALGKILEVVQNPTKGFPTLGVFTHLGFFGTMNEIPISIFVSFEEPCVTVIRTVVRATQDRNKSVRREEVCNIAPFGGFD